MLLLEHHGKALLRTCGIGTPSGVVVTDQSTLSAAMAALPKRVVLKAQIAAGGRGKGGGIAFAEGSDNAESALRRLLGARINGHTVESVLVEEWLEFIRERYAAITVDSGGLRLLFGRVGGVDIEEVTSADDTNVCSIAVDPIEGPSTDQLQDCFDLLGFGHEYRPSYEKLARSLFDLARTCDATLVEINPLVELSAGRLLALDGRVTIDSAALDRQPEIAAILGHRRTAGFATRSAAGSSIRQNPSGGAIGLIGLGGGLNVTLMDWIADFAAQVGMLVDIDEYVGSGRAEEGFVHALTTFDAAPGIRAILINIITCGYRLEEIVAALLRALDRRSAHASKPITLHLRGNGMEKAEDLLRSSRWPNSESIRAAIETVVTAARADHGNPLER